MYNYSSDIEYMKVQNDTIYRKDFLKAFQKDKFEYKEINNIQEKLFDKFKTNDKLKKIIKFIKEKANPFPIMITDFECFVIMFSYQYFYMTHLVLKDLLTTNDILDENFNKFEKYFNNI